VAASNYCPCESVLPVAPCAAVTGTLVDMMENH
jgi:hypothetical protein